MTRSEFLARSYYKGENKSCFSARHDYALYTKRRAKRRNCICKRAYGLGSQCCPNKCLFGSGKPQGVGISGRGPDGQVREMQGSVYEQPKEEVDGSCHSKEGSK
jgi:hypothetical protein